MNVYEKLMEVQTKIKVGKDKFNKFGNFYYRNCESILEAAKPLCKEVGALIILTDEIQNIGVKNYVVSTALFVDLETGDKIEVTANAREDESKKGMDSAQLTGSTTSYARKCALGGLLGLDDNKDADDNSENDEQEPLPTCAVCGKVIDDPNAIDYIRRTGKQIRCMECSKR